MILYNRLWVTMKQQHVTTYTLREMHGIDTKTVQKLQRNQNVTTKTLNKLCKILNCKLEDIAEYIPDEDD